jgi:hypothetical protein
MRRGFASNEIRADVGLLDLARPEVCAAWHPLSFTQSAVLVEKTRRDAGASQLDVLGCGH